MKKFMLFAIGPILGVVVTKISCAGPLGGAGCIGNIIIFLPLFTLLGTIFSIKFLSPPGPSTIFFAAFAGFFSSVATYVVTQALFSNYFDQWLLLSSVVSLIVPIFIYRFFRKGDVKQPDTVN